MAIDPNSIGAVTEPMLFEWTDRDTLLYAIGVGAGTGDLAFTTENSHGIDQQVLPTYAVICCPAFGAAAKVGTFNPAALLHGSQGIRLHAPLPGGRKTVGGHRGRRHPGQGGGQERHRCAARPRLRPGIGFVGCRNAYHVGASGSGVSEERGVSGRPRRNFRTATPTPESICRPVRTRR